MTLIQAQFTNKSYVSFWYCPKCSRGVVIQSSFIVFDGHCPDCVTKLEESTNTRSMQSFINIELEPVTDPSKNHEPN